MASAVTLINLSGYTWGIASDETAANVEELGIEVKPEFISPLPSINGCRMGAAVASMMKTVTMSGEKGGSTGIFAAVPTTAFVPVNSTAYFGAPTTGLYLTSGTITLNRAAFVKFNATLEAYAGQP